MGPPAELIDRLLAQPTLLTSFEWHDAIDSTNRRAVELARGGAPEGAAVAADVQRAGRGRLGRTWQAPAGSSLMWSVVLRPAQPPRRWGLLPLLAGLALAETAAAHLGGVRVALKWPNDLLVGERKAAGILVEAAGDAVVVGMGVNVDWRAVARPAALAGATSLAEAAGGTVDRWRLFAGLVGVLGRRYDAWQRDPAGFLPSYRARCATLGRTVTVEAADGSVLHGVAEDVDDRGALGVRVAGRVQRLHAGDVVHVRPGPG